MSFAYCLLDDNSNPLDSIFLPNTDFDLTGVGTNAGKTVTQTVAAADTAFVTKLTASSDAAALYSITSGTAGGGDETTLWRLRLSGAGTINIDFQKPLRITAGKAVNLKISASTTNCEVNGSGFLLRSNTIPG